MQNPVGDMVVSDHVKDLGFIDVPRIGMRMQNPVAIHGKGLAVVFGLPFLKAPPESILAQAGKRRQTLGLQGVQLIFQGKQMRGGNMAHGRMIRWCHKLKR